MDGIVNVLKPPQMTSHDVVGYLRGVFKIKRIGHTGTLDPDACGVLPICIGKATKTVDYLTDKTKKYRAELVLGVTTDTEDATGKILQKMPVNITKEDLTKTMKSFVGEIWQVPPMYSAVKIEGKKLYELARAGKTIEREARKVQIINIKLIDFNQKEETVFFDVECSKGTYIRTLCKDIGEKLGCGAHMGFLMRTASGQFNVEESFTLDEISELYNNSKYDFLIPTDSIYSQFKGVTVKEGSMKWVLNGGEIFSKDIEDKVPFENSEFVRVYDSKGNFLAVYKVKDEEKLSFVPETMFLIDN